MMHRKKPTAELQFSTKAGRTEAHVLLPVCRGERNAQMTVVKKMALFGPDDGHSAGNSCRPTRGFPISLLQVSEYPCSSSNTVNYISAKWGAGWRKAPGCWCFGHHVSGHPLCWWSCCKLSESPSTATGEKDCKDTMHVIQETDFHPHPQRKWGRNH